MIYKNQKDIQAKLTKNLLDMIVLRLINHQAMHGYQVITQTRKIFGIYFGPSTIYPLLANLEKKGYINSEWNMTADKPRKVFTITNGGKVRIKSAENTLSLICKTLNTLNLDKK
ncbi:MAG: PadR family transcriptional regulator [Nitrososphaerota archaeon]|nr:PadR family transcriptional regulator [Nitrososphaerota archaeon]